MSVEENIHPLSRLFLIQNVHSTSTSIHSTSAHESHLFQSTVARLWFLIGWLTCACCGGSEVTTKNDKERRGWPPFQMGHNRSNCIFNRLSDVSTKNHNILLTISRHLITYSTCVQITSSRGVQVQKEKHTDAQTKQIKCHSLSKTRNQKWYATSNESVQNKMTVIKMNFETKRGVWNKQPDCQNQNTKKETKSKNINGLSKLGAHNTGRPK